MSNGVVKTSAAGVGGVSWSVVWRTACLLAAVWCFKQMIALRDWHESYATSPEWARKVAHEKLDWSDQVGRAAVTLGHRKAASKERLYDMIADVLKDVKKLPAVPDVQLWKYRQAINERKGLVAARDERIAEVDDAIDAKTSLRGRIRQLQTRRAGLTPKATAPRSERLELAKQQKLLDGDLKELIEEQDTLAKDMITLNNERASYELSYQKVLEPIDKRIKSSEDGIREAVEKGAEYARPVDKLFFLVRPQEALKIANEKSGWHIIYVATWYGLEAAILALFCGVVVPWIVALRGGKATPEAVETDMTKKVKDAIGGILSRPAAAAAGKAVAALAVTTAAAAGLVAAAGDQPPVIDPIKHEVTVETVIGPKGERGAQGEKGDTQPIPPEIAKALADQNTKLEQQTRDIADVKGVLDTVSKSTGNTAVAANGLLNQSRQMTDNMVDMVTNSKSAADTLTVINDGVAKIGDAHYWSMLGTAANARYVQESLDRLQMANAVTANGVSGVQGQVKTATAEAAEGDAVAIRVSAIGDGFLRPLNPFYKYKVREQTILAAKRAMNSGTPQAKMIEHALGFMSKQPPERIWKFENRLKSNTPKEAQGLLADLMPLILKTSRGGSDE